MVKVMEKITDVPEWWKKVHSSFPFTQVLILNFLDL
jgi:hypothetical protein